MILKLFTQPDCPKCPAAKELVKKLSATGQPLKIEAFDTTTVNGLAEASFYSVMGTPSLVLCDDRGKEIYSWRGEVPSVSHLISKLTHVNLKVIG